MKTNITTKPLVSVIIPSYNTARFISECIESVLSQTYENWEMIIVDDCSYDSSLEIIGRYVKKDIRIKLIVQAKNSGVATARNKAIEASKGDYIALLDSDDIWLPSKLEKQISLMESRSILMSFSSYYTIDTNGKTIGLYYLKKSFLNYSDMLKSSRMGTLTTIYNAKHLGKHYFQTIGHEDYVWKLSLLKKIDFAGGIEEPLARYRLVNHSLSSNKLHAAQWQWKIYREVEKLSLLKSIYYFTHYAFYGVFKYR